MKVEPTSGAGCIILLDYKTTLTAEVSSLNYNYNCKSNEIIDEFKCVFFNYFCVALVISQFCFIRITCPCNVYPLTPHFYIVKLGFTGVHFIFLFLLYNIDCGYSLEPPQRRF